MAAQEGGPSPSQLLPYFHCSVPDLARSFLDPLGPERHSAPSWPWRGGLVPAGQGRGEQGEQGEQQRHSRFLGAQPIEEPLCEKGDRTAFAFHNT